jgi:Ca2+-binding RTX toxin-like protein
MVRRVLMLMVLSLVVPASAQAATITVDGATLRFVGAPGLTNNVTFTASGANVTITREVAAGDKDPFAHGCAGGTDSAVCTGPFTLIVVDVNDSADRVTATLPGEPPVPLGLPMRIFGGNGNDALIGGGRNDEIDGGIGDDFLDGSTGDDTLSGGEGNDELKPDRGADGVSGGEGIDTVTYGLRNSPSFSLDGLANDGAPGENDLIGTDVENIMAAAESGVVTLTGDGRANHLEAVNGPSVITGGEGSDVLEGGPANDLINARDSSPDTVICDAGIDTVFADTLDLISPTCENVSVQATPGGPFDDHAPGLAWSAPAAGASLRANTPTTLSVDASDDRGLAKVQFLDDDRLVCEDVAAPFECAYQPRGGDVGRNTLVAIAVDTAGQTTSLVRAVTVRRFTPSSFSLRLRPSRDRRAPYSFRATGELRRPPTVSPSQGCSGRVVITAKRGKRTVSRTRTSLKRTCEYAKTIRFRSRVASRIRLTAKFEGNDVISSRTARSRTARLG